MYTTSAPVADRITSYCRTWRMQLARGSEVLSGDTITSASSTVQSTSLSDDIELGAVCSQSWQLSIADSSGDFLGKEYDLSLYLIDYAHGDTTYADLSNYTYSQLSRMSVEQVTKLGEVLGAEYIPMGKYTCVKSKKSGGSTDVTFADRLYFSDRVYKPRLALPASSRAIEDDICRQLGLQNGNTYTVSQKLRVKGGARLYAKGHVRLKTADFDFKISEIPDKTTMRQMLSYIASAQGQFGYVDRHGRYVRKWYGHSIMTLDNNTIDLPTLSERQNVITGIACKVSDDVTMQRGDVSGVTGRVLEFENPYMTDSLFESLWHRISGFAWYTTELYHRLGDPRLDIGDVVTYASGDTRYDIPITSLGYTYDGGLSADISAVGLSVEEQIEQL